MTGSLRPAVSIPTIRPVNPDPHTLPDHAVRESRRAKHVHLRYSLRDGLEVVVPPGFDRSEIPQLLREKARWIARAERDIAAQHALVARQPHDRLPTHIELMAVEETWSVDATPTDGRRLMLREAPGRRLSLSGPIDEAKWRPALRRWLATRARSSLVPWVEELAARHRLRHGPITIRWQRTRWGSCSRRPGAGGTPASLSLNAGLLFLPPHLVRYVILHELCHTTRMDHSPAFWRRLEQVEPSTQALREELRTAWHYVPAWIETSRPTPPRESSYEESPTDSDPIDSGSGRL